MTLVEAIYRLTATFPDNERFGLVTQMRRACVSIPSNIAEGAARRSTLDYVRFLSIARGSLAELDTQIQIATRLGFAPSTTELGEVVHKTFARLNSLIHSLEQRIEKSGSAESRIPNLESRPSHAR